MQEERFLNMKEFIAFLLKNNANRLSDMPAIISDDIILSYKELYIRVHETILRLETLGICPGMNIALRFNDHIKHLVFYLALLQMEVTQFSLEPKETFRAQEKAVSLTHVTIVIQDLPPEYRLLSQTVHVSPGWDLFPLSYPWQDIIFQTVTDKTEIPSVIIVGSGTTGEPKIFAIKSSTLLHQTLRDISICPFEPKERFYCYSELYYQFPKRRNIIALFQGLTILLPRSKPDNIVTFCLGQQVDHLTLTGSQAIHLLSQEKMHKSPSRKLPNLKSLVVSSSLITEPVRQQIFESITDKLFISYGVNEFGNITEATPNDLLQHPGTVGKVTAGVTLSIVDDQGNPCNTGEIGNILVRSADMITSYLNNPKASKTAFTKEGYYPGDLGRLTEDGNLIFEGRKDDMMIYQGVNIYPREIESVLEVHPYVIESAAFPLYSKEQEHIPFAVVSVCRKISEKELLHWCASELGWKGPQRIFFVKTLPRNDAGKVLKRVLAKEMAKMLTKTG